LKYTLDLRRNGAYRHQLAFAGPEYIPTLGTIGAAIAICRQNEDWDTHFTAFLAGKWAE
jgi:hypothetical protein